MSKGAENIQFLEKPLKMFNSVAFHLSQKTLMLEIDETPFCMLNFFSWSSQWFFKKVSQFNKWIGIALWEKERWGAEILRNFWKQVSEFYNCYPIEAWEKDMWRAEIINTKSSCFYQIEKNMLVDQKYLIVNTTVIKFKIHSE